MWEWLWYTLYAWITIGVVAGIATQLCFGGACYGDQDKRFTDPIGMIWSIVCGGFIGPLMLAIFYIEWKAFL